MRKIIAFLLVAVLILALSVSAVSADGEEFVDTGHSTYTGETDIECHAYSTFMVTIPSTLYEDMDGVIRISSANIEDGYHVAVYLTNVDDVGQVTVTNASGDTGKVNIYKNGALYMQDGTGLFHEFLSYDYDENRSAYCNISFSIVPGTCTKAGDYTGVICYRVDCIPG